MKRALPVKPLNLVDTAAVTGIGTYTLTAMFRRKIGPAATLTREGLMFDFDGLIRWLKNQDEQFEFSKSKSAYRKWVKDIQHQAFN